MYDERFARQYRYEHPPEFPLTSPYTSIVHHLSGPNAYAHTCSFHKKRTSVIALVITSTFDTPASMSAHELAHTLDSLVRVSRRVAIDHFIIHATAAPQYSRTRLEAE